jgi:hypothetical protein
VVLDVSSTRSWPGTSEPRRGQSCVQGATIKTLTKAVDVHSRELMLKEDDQR